MITTIWTTWPGASLPALCKNVAVVGMHQISPQITLYNVGAHYGSGYYEVFVESTSGMIVGATLGEAKNRLEFLDEYYASLLKNRAIDHRKRATEMPEQTFWMHYIEWSNVIHHNFEAIQYVKGEFEQPMENLSFSVHYMNGKYGIIAYDAAFRTQTIKVYDHSPRSDAALKLLNTALEDPKALKQLMLAMDVPSETITWCNL